MKTVSMLEFRKSAGSVLRHVTEAQSFVLTYAPKTTFAPLAR
jgi:hypothetical protein